MFSVFAMATHAGGVVIYPVPLLFVFFFLLESVSVDDVLFIFSFKNWLELDKPVLDPSQDLPKGSQPIKVYFAFK